MSWSFYPTPNRDIPIEIDTTLTSGGYHIGDWIETAGMSSINVALQFDGGTPSVEIREAIFSANTGDPFWVFSTAIPIVSQDEYKRGQAQVNLSARYFSIYVSGGTASGSVQITVKRAA
jgi:hypothetical protein